MAKTTDIIKLVILDIDGVLTDGSITYSSSGEEIKSFNAKDGFAIKHIGRENGLEFAVITGSNCPSVLKRAKFLGVEHIYTDNIEKAGSYNKLKTELNLSDSQIAYMGDDWFDWPAMKHAGFKGAPSDATEEILERADFIAKSAGGHGAVREFIIEILKHNGNYKAAVNKYFGYDVK